jgi:hypothetical protein
MGSTSFPGFVAISSASDEKGEETNKPHVDLVKLLESAEDALKVFDHVGEQPTSCQNRLLPPLPLEAPISPKKTTRDLPRLKDGYGGWKDDGIPALLDSWPIAKVRVSAGC